MEKKRYFLEVLNVLITEKDVPQKVAQKMIIDHESTLSACYRMKDTPEEAADLIY